MFCDHCKCFHKKRLCVLIYVYCILLLPISGTNKRKGSKYIKRAHSFLLSSYPAPTLLPLLSFTVSVTCHPCSILFFPPSVSQEEAERRKTKLEEQPGPIFLFSVVFTHPPPPATTAGFWVLPVISLLLTNTVSPVWAWYYNNQKAFTVLTYF